VADGASSIATDFPAAMSVSQDLLAIMQDAPLVKPVINLGLFILKGLDVRLFDLGNETARSERARAQELRVNNEDMDTLKARIMRLVDTLLDATLLAESSTSAALQSDIRRLDE
jgi:hypothetical protein